MKCFRFTLLPKLTFLNTGRMGIALKAYYALVKIVI